MKMKKITYILLLFTAAFASCKKNELVETSTYTKINAGDPANSYIRFINMTPGSPISNYYLNGVKISGGSTTTGIEAGFTYASSFPNGGGQYVPAKVRDNSLEVKIIGPALIDPGLSIFKTTVNTSAGKYYSLITSGVYNTVDKKIPSSILIEEVKPALDTSKIFVRLINLFNDGVSNIDMVQQTTGQVIIPNVAFGTASDFTVIPSPGQSNIYRFLNTGTTTPVAATTLTAQLIKGQAYTIILRGVNGSTVTPFGVSFYSSFY